MECVGIDLGTTNSEIYRMSYEGPQVLLSQTNKPITPSRIGIDPKKSGDEAFVSGAKMMNLQNRFPENVIYESKRLIGRVFRDDFVRADRLYWPFEVVEGVDGYPYYRITQEKQAPLFLSPVEVSGEVLKLLRRSIPTDKKECSCVITVPSYFSRQQIEATQSAGELAGFNVLDTLAEPIAACIAYCWKKRVDDGYLLVYDLGGGTFDCCVVHVEDDHYDVVMKDGNTHLGGANFDNAISKVVIAEIEKKFRINPIHDKKLMAKIKAEAEKTKIALTAEVSHDFKLLVGGQEFRFPFSRNLFVQLIKTDVDSTIRYVDRALKQAQLEKTDLADVILVGGSTRIPYVRQCLSEFFQRTFATDVVNIDEAVAEGAAIYADSLMKGRHMVTGGRTEEPVYLPLGDVLEEVPYSLYLDVGEGPILLFAKGARWKETMMRVVRDLNPRFDYSAHVSFHLLRESVTGGSLQVIGHLDYPVRPDRRDKIELHVVVEYSDRGHVRLMVNIKGTQILDVLDVTCRGDVLDDYEEKQHVIQLEKLRQEVNELMIREVQKGNNERSVEKRKVFWEVLTWIQETGCEYQEEEFEEMNERVRNVL